MSRISTVFTPFVMNRVRILLAKGMNCTQIARELECDADSLRTACNRVGIHLRTVRPRNVDEVCIKVTLSPDTTDLLRKEARQRGSSIAEMAAEIIAAVVGDQLFSAVLDK